jgi:hypothetical protein
MTVAKRLRHLGDIRFAKARLGHTDASGQKKQLQPLTQGPHNDAFGVLRL